MADVQPLRALHYNLEKTGGLQDVLAPPYDVIDAEQRAELEARSPYNVVRIDLPIGNDPYETAAHTLNTWRAENVIVQDERPALWVLEQDYIGPDGASRTRHGFLARVRVENYGPGRIRPHERTHPGPKEDRLRLTRATKCNLSPIFSLYSDPSDSARRALEPATRGDPWAQATDDDGTVNRLWPVEDVRGIDSTRIALNNVELLIADGHHRYETARTYADEIAGEGEGEGELEGEHRYVLMCLVALQDPGLTVFPTHRLLKDLSAAQQEALATALRRDFEIEELSSLDQLAPRSPDQLAPRSPDQLAPRSRHGQISLGYIDSHFRRPFRLTLKDPGIADAALPGHAEAYRRLDTAVLEALILKGALGMTDEDIDHLSQLGYARDAQEALHLVQSSQYDAAFMMAPIPVDQVRSVAAAGESMPPKSTYFFPKVPTGLVFNPLG